MRLLAIACLLCGTAAGQWIHYPTAGVPRGKDGKPNLAAPAPRTADGKPDLTGMWIIADALPCPRIITDDSGECLEKTPIAQLTADLGKSVAGGLPFQPWAIEEMKRRKESGLDPHVQCLPSNFPRMFTLPHITRFLQTKGILALMNEFNASYRQIFLDGRALPVDPQPSWNGYSSGHWEGDTLVVRTNGFRDDLWMDMSGSPLTGQGTVTERIRRLRFGSLEIDATVEDPRAYTRPWTVKIPLRLVVDTEMIDEVCFENEKSAQHMKTAVK